MTGPIIAEGIAAASTAGDDDLGARGRYRHPGDVIRLITSGFLLIVVLIPCLVASDRLLGSRAASVTAVPQGVSSVLVGVGQVAALALPLVLAADLLRWRRYRLIAGLIGAAAVAAGLLAGLERLLGGVRPAAVTAAAGRGSWVTGAAFPSTAYVAGAVAVTAAVSAWLGRLARWALWAVVLLLAIVRLLAGVVLPMELLLAMLVGAVVGTGLLVALGTPDRRIGSRGVAGALLAIGMPVVSVGPAAVQGRGSRGFVAVLAGERRLFIKVLGQEQRDADLLYRGYRFLRLRGVGDVRPAASLKQAVEHQALVGMLAGRAGVRVPSVERLAAATDGSVLLVLEMVDGAPLELSRADDVSDAQMRGLWVQIDRLHRAGIAHRSLRTGNVLVDDQRRPWIVDFSFAEVAATDRQLAVDVAELLASLAMLVGPDRAVTAATAAIGPRGVASAVPLLQPLALSAATRRGMREQAGLLEATRLAAAAASGEPAAKLASLQRVRPRTLLVIALAAGAFYFLLPQLAQVGNSWRAFQSAQWGWLPLVILMSALTYVAGNFAIMGTVPQRLPFGPTLLTQSASSFVNRVTPANVGGMALNVRYLQKCGVDPATAVAAVGLNSLAGFVVHVVLLVLFLVWSGKAVGNAFKLPSSSTLLVVIAVVAAVLGAVLATRWGRRQVLHRIAGAVRSAGANLRVVAQRPAKLALLFGGSTAVTLAYIGALVVSVQAFGGGLSIVAVAAVYMGASAVAAAAPSPGGLGPLEAALVAALTGFGMASGPAVSAVLTYRLITYWLPVLPGWLSWNLLRRWAYV
jgi:uncharacterized protein (TIRG00374 family)